jgi:hypothetical protein
MRPSSSSSIQQNRRDIVHDVSLLQRKQRADPSSNWLGRLSRRFSWSSAPGTVGNRTISSSLPQNGHLPHSSSSPHQPGQH